MLSIIIPAYNESSSIVQTIECLQQVMASTDIQHEIIVVDDGSDDNTGALASRTIARVIRHPVNGGYGRAIKTGLGYASYDLCAIIDAVGSYPIERLSDLLTLVPKFDMVVGASVGRNYWGSISKRIGRICLRWLVEFVFGASVPDPNSGMRVFRKDIALQHIQRISSGFSFTTTLTLAMFLDEHFVQYVPIEYSPRVGKSKVKIGVDILRTLQILIQAVLYYNPLKLFLPICLAAVGVGLIAAIIELLRSSANGWALFSFSILVSFVIGAIGLLAEAIRLQRLSPK